MARRGRCRCGTLLVFEMTSQGYKTRCPSCRAVVRLRIEQPAPVLEAVASLGDLGIRRTSAPVADPELPAYREPAKNGGSWLLWAALGGAFAAIAAGVAVVYVN